MRYTAFTVIVVAAAFGAAPCLAADAPAGTRSFLQVIFEGAEWPGVVIVALSLAAVTLVIEHFWTIRRSTMVPDGEIETTREMIEARRFKECIEYLRTRRSMFADVLTTGLRHGRHGFEAMHETVNDRAGAWSSRLFRKAEYLNVIGNLAPLMGLLGTVLGMIEAFAAMQAARGAYKPENLAGGISLALVNTFLGLAVAIIALGFFGICRNRVDALTVAAHAAAVEILEYFRPVAVGAAAGAGGTAINSVSGPAAAGESAGPGGSRDAPGSERASRSPSPPSSGSSADTGHERAPAKLPGPMPRAAGASAGRTEDA